MGGLPGSVPKVVIWELHHLLIPHSSATSKRQLCCPCPVGLFLPLQEEERALPANSPGPQTSFHSGLLSGPEKETFRNLPGVCSGRAACLRRSAHRSALQRARMPGEGKDHHLAPCTGPVLSQVNMEKAMEILQKQSLPQLSEWAPERSA